MPTEADVYLEILIESLTELERTPDESKRAIEAMVVGGPRLSGTVVNTLLELYICLHTEDVVKPLGSPGLY